MNTPQPYNMAAKFADQDQAKQVYIELESRLKALRFDAHVSRVMVKNEMYVSFLSERPEGTIPAPVLQEVRRILSSKGGQITHLPPEAIANIQARRQARRAQGVGQYESHEPVQSSYKYPAIRDAETKEILAEYPESGELTGERPYTGPLPGSPVYPAKLEDLPEELRDQAARMQEEIRRKQQQKADTKAAIVPPVPAPASQHRPTPGKASKPLVERYLTYLRVARESAQARLHDKTGLTRDQFNFNLLLMTSYGDTYNRLASKALKYQLAASAQTMIEALRPRPLLLADMSIEIMADIGTHKRELDPDIDTPILHLPAAPIWLELEQPVQAANGDIAGIFFSCADRETELMLAEEHRPGIREVLKASVKQPGQEYKWSVHFISSDGTPSTSYEYHEESHVWFIVPSTDGRELCPTGECKEQPRDDGTFYIVPCAFCAAIMGYWRSWLVTALLAVAGEFAATETAEWPRHREQTTRKVKRPNSAKYDEIQVSHDYYLVSFDASVRRIRQERPQQEQEREPQERGSWVAAAQEIDPSSVVYVRHDFGQSQRKLDPERNPRWKEKRTVEVKAHSKHVPMKVDGLQKRITRVVASRYGKPGDNS